MLCDFHDTRALNESILSQTYQRKRQLQVHVWKIYNILSYYIIQFCCIYIQWEWV